MKNCKDDIWYILSMYGSFRIQLYKEFLIIFSYGDNVI